MTRAARVAFLAQVAMACSGTPGHPSNSSDARSKPRLDAGASSATGGTLFDPSIARTALDASARSAVDAGGRSVYPQDGSLASADDADLPLDAAQPQKQPLAASAIAAGYQHACVITTSGELYCWGQNGLGQLGLGDTLDRSAPVRVGDDGDWMAIAVGRFHSCGVRAGGQLFCWGDNSFGQAASPDPGPLLAPTRVLMPEVSFRAVSLGDWHGCALDDGGQLYCFGHDLLGRLGNGKGLGDSRDPGANVSTPSAIDPGIVYTAVDAGGAHTCGLREDGSVWCWGLDDRGQLGAPPADNCMLNTVATLCSLRPIAIAIASERQFVAVSAGGAHSCAITNDNQMLCFGANDYGQLGSGGTNASSVPDPVGGEFTRLSAGGNHTCAVRTDGRIACFGDGESGQLGAVVQSSEVPLDLAILSSVGAVSAGTLCTCASAADAVSCWGDCAFSASRVPRLVFPL